MPDLRNDPEIDRVEELLKGHLAQRLDPHVGRAGEAFAAHIQQTSAAAPSHRFILWWAPAIGALAACVVIGLVVRQWYQKPVASGPRTETQTRVEEPSIEVQHTISWQNFDEGTVMVDEHTPVRRVRREVLETSKWYDPVHKSLVEVSLPRQEVMLIGLNMQ